MRRAETVALLESLHRPDVESIKANWLDSIDPLATLEESHRAMFLIRAMRRWLLQFGTASPDGHRDEHPVAKAAPTTRHLGAYAGRISRGSEARFLEQYACRPRRPPGHAHTHAAMTVVVYATNFTYRFGSQAWNAAMWAQANTIFYHPGGS